jgi:hypothetical protein
MEKKDQKEAVVDIGGTKETGVPEKCPKCGIMVKDPFGMGKIIHDIENCQGFYFKDKSRRTE